MASTVALAGWALREASLRRAARSNLPTPRYRSSKRTEDLIIIGIGIVALAGLRVAPTVGVFLLLVALNQLLGRSESVPFSRYPMFARPGNRSWSLRFEGESGELVAIGLMGILPPTARKRFDSSFRAARAAFKDVAEARTIAAEVLAEWVEQRRPADGPLARTAICIVLVEYEFDGREIRSTKTALAVSTPA